MLALIRAILFIFFLSLFSSCAFAVASNCSVFVSPTGSGTGLTAASPETLAQANSTGSGGAIAGSVVCLEGGIYNLVSAFLPVRSGRSLAYITWPPATLIVNNVVYGNGGRGIMVNDNDGNRRLLILEEME
jgi:hypothetical protein